MWRAVSKQQRLYGVLSVPLVQIIKRLFLLARRLSEGDSIGLRAAPRHAKMLPAGPPNKTAVPTVLTCCVCHALAGYSPGSR